MSWADSASYPEAIDFDAGLAQAAEAFAGDGGIGIGHGGDDAGDTGGDERIGAGTAASGVGAGLRVT